MIQQNNILFLDISSFNQALPRLRHLIIFIKSTVPIHQIMFFYEYVIFNCLNILRSESCILGNTDSICFTMSNFLIISNGMFGRPIAEWIQCSACFDYIMLCPRLHYLRRIIPGHRPPICSSLVAFAPGNAENLLPMIQGLLLKPCPTTFFQLVDGLLAFQLAPIHRRKVAKAMRMHWQARRGVLWVDAFTQAVQVRLGIEVADVELGVARRQLPLEGHDGVIVHVLLSKAVCPCSGRFCPGDALGHVAALLYFMEV